MSESTNKQASKSKEHPPVNIDIPGDKMSDNTINKLLLLPVVFIIAILPLIVRQHAYDPRLGDFNWFPSTIKLYDYFLYYKQVYFIFAFIIMIMIIVAKAWFDRKSLVYRPIFIPLGAYALLSLLSSVFSKYSKYTYKGMYEQFESVFVLLGYCLLVYYITLIVKTEQDVKFIINSLLVSIIALSILGLTQFLGRDFLRSDMGMRLITPKSQWDSFEDLIFQFDLKTVYLTLYNPNYVGVYAAMVIPLLALLLFFNRKLLMIPVYLLAIGGILVSLIGSGSKASIVALGVAGLCAVLVLAKYILKYFYITIPLILIILIAVFIVNKKYDNALFRSLQNAFSLEKTEKDLSDIQTLEDKVSITYKGNTLYVSYYVQDGYAYISAVDDTNVEIPMVISGANDFYASTDVRFPGFRFSTANFNNILFLNIIIEDKPWYFTNQVTDGGYYYLNRFGKLDKIIPAPSAVFTGYEGYASLRGYIWSRTLPLLKKYPVLGSGADTYIMAFPQQDYLNLYNYGYGEQILTKPHSLYLQIGVQTGVLSLIAFLVFYGMYFISSLRLYIKGHFKSFYAQVGIGIMMATVSYMVMGISNDSSLTVAPVFWALIGLGIAVNRLAKPFIAEEAALAKEAKARRKEKQQ